MGTCIPKRAQNAAARFNGAFGLFIRISSALKPPDATASSGNKERKRTSASLQTEAHI
jgi:hypothetical protein